MLITRRSPLSGINNTMDIDIVPEQIELWHSGVLIQNAMPHLTNAEREFIMTGLTETDWNVMMSAEEDEEE